MSIEKKQMAVFRYRAWKCLLRELTNARGTWVTLVRKKDRKYWKLDARETANRRKLKLVRDYSHKKMLEQASGVNDTIRQQVLEQLQQQQQQQSQPQQQQPQQSFEPSFPQLSIKVPPRPKADAPLLRPSEKDTIRTLIGERDGSIKRNPRQKIGQQRPRPKAMHYDKPFNGEVIDDNLEENNKPNTTVSTTTVSASVDTTITKTEITNETNDTTTSTNTTTPLNNTPTTATNTPIQPNSTKESDTPPKEAKSQEEIRQIKPQVSTPEHLSTKRQSRSAPAMTPKLGPALVLSQSLQISPDSYDLEEVRLS